MYVRKDRGRRRKNGKSKTRVSIAHNVRVEDGKGGSVSKPIVLAHLGDEADLDEAKVDGMIAALERYKAKRRAELAAQGQSESAVQEATALKTVVRDATPALRVLASKQVGARMAVEAIWEELGLAEILRGLERDVCRTLPLERLVFAMVLHRLVDPGSKLACNDWVKDVAWFPEAEDWSEDDFYRTLDAIDRSHVRLDGALAKRALASATPAERSRLLLDTTATFTEADLDDEEISMLAREWHAHDLEDGPLPEDPRPQVVNRPALRMRGKSKDGRPDAPQVVVGVGMLGSGEIGWQRVFAGNTSDKQVTLAAAESVLPAWRKANPGGRLVVVMDAGMAGKPNLRKLAALGDDVGWLAGCPVRNNKVVDGLLLTPGSWPTVSKGRGDAWEIQSVALPEADRAVADRPEWVVVVRNPVRARRDRRKLDREITEVQELLAKDAAPSKDGRANRLLTTPRFTRLVRQEGEVLVLDARVVELEQARCGVRVHRTTERPDDQGTIPAEYDELLHVEDAFRAYKNPLALRPMFHRAARRIRAHVFVCRLAITVMREIERRTSSTWLQVLRTLTPLTAVRMQQGTATWWQRGWLPPDAQAVFDALGRQLGPERWASSAIQLTKRAKAEVAST